ncbi:MAG: prepilin-type N-terminal cleavage/methylation domain-containing protein [Sinobacterium sp.]
MSRFKPKNKGFTLIELVIVLVLLGILSVAVYPRMTGKGGIVEYTYQARLVSALRAMQQRAMQDTRNGFCFKLAVFSDNNSAFGPPTLDYTVDGATNKALTCANLISTDLDNSHMIATKADMLDDNVMITDAPNFVQFNNMGCTIDVSGNACSTDMRIEIQGKNSIAVCIKSQGYIHVCD